MIAAVAIISKQFLPTQVPVPTISASSSALPLLPSQVTSTPSVIPIPSPSQVTLTPSITPIPSSASIITIPSSPSITSTSPSKQPNEDVEAEQYKKTSCGSVIDSKTGLEWYIGLDQNVTWNEANIWVTNLEFCSGGWRMPMINELASLYNKTFTAGRGYFSGGRYFPAHIHPAFSEIGGGSWVWSNEQVGNEVARSFNFNQGMSVDYFRNNTTYSTRAFAVRSKQPD